MFDFKEDETGSEERYEQRRSVFVAGQDVDLGLVHALIKKAVDELNQQESGLPNHLPKPPLWWATRRALHYALTAQKKLANAAENKAKPLPVIRHYGWWVLHNCVSHFIMGIWPTRWTFNFHDWTSRKLNGK